MDTTMGFTPLDGLMMGTRSGSVDPGVLIFLMRMDGLNYQQIDKLLNHESGLLGVSGFSSDMRQIQEAMDKGHERAKLAFEIFVHRLQKAIGAMAAVLGGVDVLVFTAGVGENSKKVRAATCSNLEFLGIKIAQNLNEETSLDRDIATPESRRACPSDSSRGGLGHRDRVLEACPHQTTNGCSRLIRENAMPTPCHPITREADR